MLKIPDYLGGCVIPPIILLVVPGHKVPYFKTVFPVAESGDQDGGVFLVMLADFVVVPNQDLKTATPYLIQDFCEDGGGIEFRETTPVQGTGFGNKGGTATVANNAIVEVIHILKNY